MPVLISCDTNFAPVGCPDGIFAPVGCADGAPVGGADEGVGRGGAGALDEAAVGSCSWSSSLLIWATTSSNVGTCFATPKINPKP